MRMRTNCSCGKTTRPQNLSWAEEKDTCFDFAPVHVSDSPAGFYIVYFKKLMNYPQSVESCFDSQLIWKLSQHIWKRMVFTGFLCDCSIFPIFSTAQCFIRIYIVSFFIVPTWITKRWNVLVLHKETLNPNVTAQLFQGKVQKLNVDISKQ